MTNLKLILAKDLISLLQSNSDAQAIASWADHLYWQNIGQNICELEDIAFMDAGPEFILSREELYEIVRKWQSEGEYEELGSPIPEIKKSAEDIGKGWLYCPICHEVWESSSHYGMVECPGCKNKLHNPKYKPETSQKNS